jgi:hypothetical protein
VAIRNRAGHVMFSHGGEHVESVGWDESGG